MSEKLEWDSSLSFIFAMIGAAVGLGNIWRFSYVLYSNGGGSFFIPYFIAIAIMGIPFLILEYGVGFSFKESFSKILKDINERFEYIAWALVLFVFIVTIYYMVILSWDMVYLLSSFTFSWGTDTAAYFSTTVGGSSDLAGAGFLLVPTTICVILMWIVLWYISHKDVDEGIGKVSKVLIPSLFVIMAIIVIYALTLPGHMIGVDALLRPRWSMLLDINIWLAAFAQIIFSLSMGQAIALTYASYLPKASKLTDNVLVVVASNSLFEIFTAFGVFSILGYMSLQSGTAVADLVTQGTGLVFIVYPTVFNVLDQWAYVLGPLFFLTVYLAGLTSILSTIEPLSFSIQNKFGLSRKRTMTILIIVGALVSMVYATSFGGDLLGFVDTFINQIALLFGVIVECILFAWEFKADKLIDFLNKRTKTIKVGGWWIVIVKYVLPIFLAIVWIGGMYDVISAGTFDQLVFTVISAVLLLGATLIFTVLPAKNPDWDKTEERV